MAAAPQTNSDVVVEYIRRFDTGDLDHAFELLADDCVWEVMGDSVIAGRHDKTAIRAVSQGVVDTFTAPPRWTPLVVTAQDDRVAVEAVSSGDAVSGFAYRNRYHLLVTLRDGLITEVKEYMDTKHLADLIASMDAYRAALSPSA